jgi:hypothetical protein
LGTGERTLVKSLACSPVPNLRTSRCTIGMSLSLTLYTTTSPTSTSASMFRFQSKSRSPRWNAGSMEPERTTTMGLWESEAMERPFHICEIMHCQYSGFKGENGNAGVERAPPGLPKVIRLTMNAVDRMRAKFSSCAAPCRGFAMTPTIVTFLACKKGDLCARVLLGRM